MTAWSILLPSWPTGDRFAQLKSPTWDGSPSEDKTKQCGPTALSAIIYWLTGTFVPGDAIKDAILGQGKTGPTSLAQLREFAADWASVPSTVLHPATTAGNATGSLLNLEWSATVAGHPVLLLRHFSATVKDPHWCVTVGLDPDHVYVFDPYTGALRIETYDEHRALYLGDSVAGGGMARIDRDRDRWLDLP